MRVVLSVLEKSFDKYGKTALLQKFVIDVSCIGCDGVRGIERLG